MLDAFATAARRYGALVIALLALLALLLLAGCGGGDGCDTQQIGPDGQCDERRTTQPVDCQATPERCQ